jgi:hypothetical protein
MQALFGVKTKQVEVTQAVANTAGAANNAAAAQNNLGNATKKAAAKAKGSLAAFDEINQLQEQMADSADDAAGGGVGGISGGGMVVPDAGAGKSPIPENLIPQSMLDNIEKFKRKLADLREWFQPVIDKFDLLKEAAVKFGKTLYNLVITNPYVQGWIERTKKQFANLAEGLKLVLGGSFEFLAGQFNEMTGIMTGDFELWETGFEQTCSGLADIAIGILMPIFPNIAKSLKEGKTRWEETWAGMKGDIKKYGDPTKLEASDFGQYIRDKLYEKWQGVKTDTQTNWEENKTILSTKWGEIKTDAGIKWEDIRTTISTKWGEIKKIDWNTVKGAVNTVWEDIKIATGNIWESIKNIFKEGANGAIGTLEKFLNSAIKGFNKLILAWNETKSMLGISGWTNPINDIKIPRLAQGGIISSPTLAMIGESGKEAVVPLENTSFVDTLASAVGNAVLTAMQFGQGNSSNSPQGEMALYLDGDKFARAITPLIDKERGRRGSAAIATT